MLPEDVPSTTKDCGLITTKRQDFVPLEIGKERGSPPILDWTTFDPSLLENLKKFLQLKGWQSVKKWPPEPKKSYIKIKTLRL